MRARAEALGRWERRPVTRDLADRLSGSNDEEEGEDGQASSTVVGPWVFVKVRR